MCIRKMICVLGAGFAMFGPLMCAYGGEPAQKLNWPGTTTNLGQPMGAASAPLHSPVGQAWRETLQAIDERMGDRIAVQFEELQQIAPELALDYCLITGYSRYLERVTIEIPTSLIGYTPWPPDPAPPGCEDPLPGREDRCACLNGDALACRRWIENTYIEEDEEEEIVIGPLIELPTCEEVKAAYIEALQCILDIMMKKNRTPFDWIQLAQCQVDAASYWSHYVAMGCADSEVLQLAQDPNWPVPQ